MRVVSWIVVVLSIGWLIASYLDFDSQALESLDVPRQHVTGSTAQTEDLERFAQRYTAAWNSHKGKRVAAFFVPGGTYQVNEDEPVAGRADIAAMVDEFISEVPDARFDLTGLERRGETVVFSWRLQGTHGESGRAVRMAGTETWKLDADGLITHAAEDWDEAAYAAQVRGD